MRVPEEEYDREKPSRKTDVTVTPCRSGSATYTRDPTTPARDEGTSMMSSKRRGNVALDGDLNGYP